MKIIQLNVWCGRVRDSTVTFLKEENADIVCTQEIIHSQKKLPGLFDSVQIHNQISELYPYVYFSPTFDYQQMDSKILFGNAIYSKFPISDEETIFTHESYIENRSLHIGDNKSGRNLQLCKVTSPYGEFIVANHHGHHTFHHHGDENSIKSLTVVADALSQVGSPLIFCGDLNTSYESEAIKVFDKSGLRNITKERNVQTTLSELSRVPVDVPCDYIFTSEEVKLLNFSVSEKIISDHKALILEFTIE